MATNTPAPVLVGDDLRNYWQRRLAATWRHGGIPSAIKQFQTLWKDAQADAVRVRNAALLTTLQQASKALLEVYEFVPQLTLLEERVRDAGLSIDALVVEIELTKGGNNNECESSKET